MTSSPDRALLQGARICLSPNQDQRPEGCQVELLVVHSISLPPGQFGGPWIEALFMNRLPADQHPYFEEICQLRVSAHLLIRRDGEIVQYVPFDRRAWHAGESCFQGRPRCNDFSIGVELEGDEETDYTDAQYQALLVTTRKIMKRYPMITADRVVGHSDIAPGRKSDPGPAFDWQRLLPELTADAASAGEKSGV